jgi:hypothetical protein
MEVLFFIDLEKPQLLTIDKRERLAMRCFKRHIQGDFSIVQLLIAQMTACSFFLESFVLKYIVDRLHRRCVQMS